MDERKKKAETEDETYTHTPSDYYYCKKNCLILRNRNKKPIVKQQKTKSNKCVKQIEFSVVS